ncbi:MAG: 50S ribosomal protein L29 [Leptospirillum sp.]|uniref:Large ribosomal subunit protein uL29 n=1 Tax=Leptospirillum ferriphilum TaxID=178606 RepID=A0A7C3QW29_9BACT
MKSKDIRTLSEAELKDKIQELRRELLMLRIQRVNGRLDKPHLLKEYKRDVSRMLTILTERKISKNV